MSVRNIGGDWVANTDPNTGKTYYANLTTKETTWEWPAGLPKPADEGGNEEAAEWTEALDPSSGRTYYVNKRTRETTWTKPACLVSEDDSDPATVAANWQSKLDQASGRTYYYNIVNMQTTWEKPDCLAQSSGAVASSEAAVASQAGNSSRQAEAATPSEPSTSTETRPAEPAESASSSVPATASAASTPAEPQDAHAGGAVVAPRGRSESQVADKLLALQKMKISEDSSPAAIPENAAAASGPGEDEAPERMTVSAVSPADGSPQERAYALLKSVSDPYSTDELRAEVKGLTYVEYAEKNFNFDRKGLFGSRTTTEKITSWKGGREVIKTSLSLFNDKELQSEAVQCFRNITGFMGDRSSNKGTMDHCIKLLNNMLKSMEDLRNEVFCQICKQTKNNPSLASTLLGWQLMVICLATFPPGALLRDYLMAYCLENIRPENPEVSRYADFALHCIPSIFKLGARKELPTYVEIEANKRLAPVSVRVNFLDSKYIMLPTNSWTTADHFNEMIAKRLGIKYRKPFAIFEVSSHDEERVVEGDERILDLVAYWARLQNEERAKKGNKSEVEGYHFVFKVRLFLDIPDDDVAGVEMMYIQATHDVVDARYPCSEQDSITLAAVQVQEEFGDHPGGECTYLTGKMTKYLAERYTESTSDAELEEQVLKLYSKLAGYSRQEARLSYLDYVKSWKIYGSTYYFAEPQNNRDFPPEVVLAINAKGILVVDPESKDFLTEYPYSQVVTWGHSSNSFVIVTGNMVKQTKVYFKTDQGKEMNGIVRSYVENLMTGADDQG